LPPHHFDLLQGLLVGQQPLPHEHPPKGFLFVQARVMPTRGNARKVAFPLFFVYSLEKLPQPSIPFQSRVKT